MPKTGKILIDNRPFRERVLDELDWAYETVGRPPDVMFVSSERWEEMEENRRFEKQKGERHRLSLPLDISDDKGYIGMYVVELPTLDAEKVVLVDWQTLHDNFPKAKDFYTGRP